MHSKIICIDERWAAFGSYNFESAANDRLAEAMISTQAPNLIEELIDVINTTVTQPECRRIHASSWARRPRKDRFWQAMAWPFRHWL